MIYDLFYVSNKNADKNIWEKFKEKFPTARLLENVSEFDQIKSKAFTKFFWVVWDDFVVEDNFNFEYRISKWDEQYIHVFRNGKYFDGICIFSKSSVVSKKEFTHRFFTNKKEIDIPASIPIPYDKFYITTYDEYLNAVSNSTTDLFWVVWNDIIVEDNFNFDYQISKWDEQYIHVFRNGKYFDGICIFSKSSVVSKKEFTHRFFTNKKEIDIPASIPIPYDKFYITTYDEYLNAVSNSTTDLFWVVWNDIIVEDNFNFDYQISKWDEQYIHVFRNGKYFDGICVFNKKFIVSKKEFTHRFFTDKKEIDILASIPKPYDKFYITTYDEYLNAVSNSTTDLFWVIWPEIEIINEEIFSLQISKNSVHDLNENHVFKHLFRKEETYNNGIVLFSKNKPITEKEFNFRFLIEKKEHEIVVSKLKPYEIVFISYNEINADTNYQKLLEKFSTAKRIHGVKGIHQAHIEAARKVETEMFWVVDADAIIEPSFNFDYEVSRYDLDVVHVWQSCNPINDLVYGYGGVKLLPKKLTIDMDVSKPDMTTSISTKFKAMESVSNITAFNTDEFSTWKSAFRECVKLASRTISGQDNIETQERLEIWKTIGSDKLYGNYAIQGAIDGEEYGLKYKDTPESLRRINDFDWLKEYYEQRTKNIHP